MKLLAFAASHRPDSFNKKLVQIACAHLRKLEIDVDIADYSEFDMPLHNAAIAMPELCHSFARRAQHADGIVIALPEYNWSYPASLKNIIEWTSCIDPYPLAGKTALLMSASPGSRGGIMGLQHFKTPLEESGMHVFHKVFPLGNAETAITKNATLADSKQQQHLVSILDEYVTFTQHLANR